jgi:hypothetical protein
MHRPPRRLRNTLLGSAAFATLAGLNAPAAIGFAQREYHEYTITRPAYEQRYGRWRIASMPAAYKLNSIHATLLRTGKVLLIAGSGNNIRNFDGGAFKSTLWDPARNTFKKIPTPKDLFCGGHTQLSDGRVLVAGGTARYETLKGDVKRAGGAMLVKNEDPDSARTFRKGTVFRAPSGKEYVAQFSVRVPRAAKHRDARTGKVTVTAGQARVYVESAHNGAQWSTNTAEQYTVVGLHGKDRRNYYGLAQRLGMDKKDFQGIRAAYEFDPVAEKYVPVQSMSTARWYPTLVHLADGRVIAVSGLDDEGQIIPGVNEYFHPGSRTWSPAPNQYFPTYPALFLMKGGNLFYTGSNAGYGPADQGRTPGIWNLRNDTFHIVPGLRDPGILETSSSVLLPPAQDQKVMVLGGGGVGESPLSTARTAVADLKAAHPRWTPGPNLPEPTRYLNSVILPDDTVLTTGGSRGYRGKGASNILGAQVYHPGSNTFTRAAAPTVGRDYHTEALLLPDGRVAVFGSDPLFGDKHDDIPGTFEQRVEVYSPPYLYHADRPTLGPGPTEVRRGGSATFRTRDAARIVRARLMHPGSSTHVTDTDQRSIALTLHRGPHSITVTVPKDPTLVPPGWYMVFVTDAHGTPAKARWVHVS